MRMSSLLLTQLFLLLHILFTLTSSRPTPFNPLLPSASQPVLFSSLLSPDHPFSLSKSSPRIITKPDSFVSVDESNHRLRGDWKPAPSVMQTLPYHMTQGPSDVTYICTGIHCRDKTEEIDTTKGRGEISHVKRVGLSFLIVIVVIFKLAGILYLCKNRLGHFQKKQQQQSAEALKRIQQSQNELMQVYFKAYVARVASNAAMKAKVHIVVTMCEDGLTVTTDPVVADTWSEPASPPCTCPLFQHSLTTSNQSMPSMMQNNCPTPATLSVNRAEVWCSMDGLLRTYHEVDHGVEEEEEDTDEGYEDDKHNNGGEPDSEMWDFYCVTNELTQEQSCCIRLSREAGSDTASRTRGVKTQVCHGGHHSSRSIQ